MIEIILITIAVIMIIESSVILAFKKDVIKILKDVVKKPNLLRKFGFIELIIGLILLIFSFLF